MTVLTLLAELLGLIGLPAIIAIGIMQACAERGT